MINIICVGKIKEKYLTEGINDYYKRISKYHKINIVEIKDENNIELESQSILKQIKKENHVILLDLSGEEKSSTYFSQMISDLFIEGNSSIDLIVGGSDGVSKQVKERANKMISFSKMTFPHGLFRMIILEQIYRSFKIMNKETYHK